jgi:pyruvate dehydrogenase E2 component (dihydrolipoamide acetyltransferase)
MLLEAAKKDFEERYGKPDVPGTAPKRSAAGLLTGAPKGAVSGAPKPPDQKEGDWQDVDATVAAAGGPPAAAAAAPDGSAVPAAPTAAPKAAPTAAPTATPTAAPRAAPTAAS